MWNFKIQDKLQAFGKMLMCQFLYDIKVQTCHSTKICIFELIEYIKFNDGMVDWSIDIILVRQSLYTYKIIYFPIISLPSTFLN
jgi:hypothetical protein